MNLAERNDDEIGILVVKAFLLSDRIVGSPERLVGVSAVWWNRLRLADFLRQLRVTASVELCLTELIIRLSELHCSCYESSANAQVPN